MNAPEVALIKERQTALGLYVTAREAYEQWKAAPESIKIIDVRTPEEFLFVGHPAMAWKIPVASQSYEWNAEQQRFPMQPLPDFVARVGRIAGLDDTLMVMCRAGGRGAMAANLLAQAGYTKVYNILDGMEGDKVEDPASVLRGQPMVNGWKNSGCPWTYNLTPNNCCYRRPVEPNRSLQAAIMRFLIIPLGLSIAVATAADDVELAKQLSNPIADLISAPIQTNYDFGIGAGDGTRWTTNIQPVIPFSITEDWNLISRTVLPVVDQQGVAVGGAGDAFGLGDTIQSFFFSPKASSPIWGVGPAFLLPTATDDLLGGDQWGMGPTAVVLKQTGPWTYGALANHLWDFAGDSGRPGVNATFIQPFLAYTLPTATTFTLNLECTYDWREDQWTVPLNFQVSQLVKFGSQPVQLFAGIRFFPEAPDDGPEWGLRFGMTFLFPKS